MQVTELESTGLKHSLRIVVEAAAIETQVETELKAAGARVKIPGFRPGYIPMKILRQRYGKEVQEGVINQAINQSTVDALKQKNLKPAVTPQLKVEGYKEGADLAFTLDFEIFPDIPAMSFDKITLTRPTFEVAEKDIDEAVQRLAAHSPRIMSAPEGAKAKEGHVVVIDFRGSIDGKPFDGGSADDFRLELGSGQFIEGFEEQLIGAKKGDERIVNVTFPKDYGAQNLAGRAASFAVKIKEIHVKETPVIDEEFAKARGFADLDALRETVCGQITREYEGLARSRLKKQLFDMLDAEYDFALPQGMLDLEFNNIWERVRQSAGEAADEAEYRDIARRRVKLGLMLAEIGNRNGLQVTGEEMGRAVMQQASMYPGQEKKVMDFYRSHPEHASELRGPILEEKAVDFILGKVTFDDHKVTLEELAGDDGDGESSGKKPAKAGKARGKKKAEG
ncbi:MAG: trigger factor [Pseudomonadota bacterium]|nr:trigger factor [Pseudomonadota bacterium]